MKILEFIPTPGLFTSGDLRKDGLTLFAKLIRTKTVEGMDGGLPQSTRPDPINDKKLKLKRCLTTLDLTSLGVGSCVGTGMYLVAGLVAHKVAGPGVIISFIIAAVASIFSGACYAEFGVRVPHTTGSAYMYSYVTVGEFIAFVIGWNMVLEYLIGTSACACALSACFDALTHGAITSSIKTSFGTIFGRPPDFLAFLITVLMMILLAAGVRKSLLFNNVLNTINLAAWVFIMTAGLFYINTDNWNLHGGFLPRGWSGVFTGAATCFYAFIGFDIIATTGEEAHNPKKSIPLAILVSLCIILLAYVTSSMVLTLVVPYDEIDPKAGLVQMFGYVGASKCQYVVAIGALAGLTVSMFGSMFPMPRISYAMAQDGLIFKELAHVLPLTGTPVFATFTLGLAAALVALLISLEVLVEMMSIGTLLAYTLVSTCVLILRYQPGSTNLMDLLPESLKTPMKGSPSKEYNIGNGQANFGNQLYPEQLKSSLKDIQPRPPPSPENPNDFQSDALLQQQKQRIMVRRVTRSSPDSDDTYAEESEECSMRDDQYLVSDRIEGKFYGSVHGTGTSGASSNPLNIGPRVEQIQRKIHAATYLCPAIFPWVDTGPPTEESGILVIKLVGVLYLLIILLDLMLKLFLGSMGSITLFIMYAFIFAIIGILLVISRKPQNKKILMFKTPCVPFVPVIAITVNIYLILKLHYLTLIRFTIWMTLGFIMYFYYGIKHSTLEEASDNIELEATIVNTQINVPKKSAPEKDKFEQYDMTEYDKRPSSSEPQTTYPKDLFVPSSAFPTWDD
uniref:Probable cationic amino acid transporter n=1 Tax=Cacopsylla melanoneura TaxID=428564 RepID=A0A8D9A1L9_9HEMI